MKARVAVAAIVVIALLASLTWWLTRPAPAPASAPESSATAPPVSTRHVAGLVVDATGHGVPNAKVTLGALTQTTPDDGTFRFEPVALGAFSVEVEADGYVLKAAPGVAAASGELRDGHPIDDLRIVLYHPAQLSGTVVAGTQPVGAKLTLLYRDSITQTDAYSIELDPASPQTGVFRAAGLAPGVVKLLAEADGFALAETREYVLDDGDDLSGIVIDMNPAGELSGTVTDVQGNPVGGVELVLNAQEQTRRLRSNSDGTFVFRHVPVGDVHVAVHAAGFTETDISGLVIAPNETTNADVVLERMAGGFGHVVDPVGFVSPAFIFVGDQQRPLVTASDGSFKALVSEPTRAEVVSPRHLSTTTTIVPGGESKVDMVRGGLVRGHVVDANGRAVSQAQVSVNWFQVDGRAPYNATVYGVTSVQASDGSFEFGPLRPGKYTLAAHAAGNANGESAAFVVTGSNDVGGVKITLPAGAVVTGRVVDEQGNPIPRARVDVFETYARFSTPSTMTDAQGSYRLEGVPVGRRSLRVVAKGYTTRLESGVETRPGENVRDIVLAATKPGSKMSFGGIGAVLGQTPDGVVVREIMENKPAALYGIQQGDLLQSVDGQDVRDMRLDRIVEMLRGEEGAPVRVEVERNGRRMRFDVTRGSVDVK